MRKLVLTILFGAPDEDGWIVARVHGIPGAISQGRTRDRARENIIEALRLVLTPDESEASTAGFGARPSRSRSGAESAMQAYTHTNSAAICTVVPLPGRTSAEKATAALARWAQFG